MNKLYAGVGSRNIPQEFFDYLVELGEHLGHLGWTLRSGGAKGSDTAFETGCDCAKGKKEIFYASDATRVSMALASRYHPNWSACSDYAKRLHGRNVFQVLGKNLVTPVDFLVAYTEGGAWIGGTAMALKIAQDNKITIYNVALSNDRKDLQKFLENLN